MMVYSLYFTILLHNIVRKLSQEVLETKIVHTIPALRALTTYFIKVQ